MFLGNAVYASDLQQQKIEQLEQLLQSYIEENSILKSENQALKDELQSQKNLANDQTAGAKETCDISPSACRDIELCEVATFKLLGKQNWKVGSYTIFVDEAKRRGLTCDVAEVEPAEKTEPEVSKKEVETAEVQTTALQRCEADLTGCSKEDLCDTGTYGIIGMKNWKVGSYTIFVDEAKRRGLTCDVLTVDQREQAELAEFSDTEICSKATHESSRGLRLNVDLDSEKFIREAGRRSLSCASLTNGIVDLNVAQIQTRLHHLGYDPGLIDGAWGGKTNSAFKEFLQVYAQTELDAKSPEAETFLYDIYEQKFEQTVKSSVPCKSITDDYERTKKGDCVVIAKYNTTSPNLFANKPEGEVFSLWDKKGIYPLIRQTKQSTPEIILWAPDQPVKPWTVHDGPGLAHMANFKIDIESIFENRNEISVINQSRKMPFNVRRYELRDLNNNGFQELFLLGDREDGRNSKKMVQGAYANQRDFKFKYDFEADQITTFGKKTKAHDYGLHDFNRDGFVDILDFNLHEINGQKGAFVYCDGQTLKCDWRSTDQFINGSSFLKYDEFTDKVFLNARCGNRYVNDQNNGKFWLCWFAVEGQGPKLKFNFIQKFELQKSFDARIKWMSWHGTMKSGYLAWKVDGYSTKERVKKSAGGTATVFEDLDNDGDLDMVTYRKDFFCVKKDKARDFYNVDDCDQYTHVDYIFLQNNGKFELSQMSEGGIRDETINYDFTDLNRDSYPDVIPRGVYYGKCIDTYENVLINNRDGTFDRTDDRFSGRYGCELASNFFEHSGQRYRVFTFKAKDWEDFDVYVALEKIVH